MLVLWKLVLGLMLVCVLWSVAGRLFRYAFLACFLLLLVGVVIGMAVIVDAQVSHAYRQAAWTLAERRQEMYDAIDFLTTTPSCLTPPSGGGWPSDWRAVRRSVRSHTALSLSARPLPYHFVVDGHSVHSGLPTAEEVSRGHGTIVLYSGGSWAGIAPAHPRLNNLLNICACASTAQLALRAAQHLRLPVPIVGFNYGTSSLDTLNIGQTDDSAMLSHVYKTVHKAHPTARLVLAGDCLGSLRLLNWLATRPELPQLHAIVLESPLPSLRHFLNVFTPFECCNQWLYEALVAIMPNYRPELETYQSFEAHGKDAFPDVPTFIGMLSDDPISHPSDLPRFIERLHQVETFVAHDKDAAGRPVFHGQIVKLPGYQHAARAFLARLQLLDSPIKPSQPTFGKASAPLSDINDPSPPKIAEPPTDMEQKLAPHIDRPSFIAPFPNTIGAFEQ